jgi:hypothetical protein
MHVRERDRRSMPLEESVFLISQMEGPKNRVEGLESTTAS